MEKLEKIEMRNIVPIAAMISAGKSKLLNVILNVNFLESKSGIGTKFVNILRYNPKIEQPQFYHLKLKAEKGKYIFYKDNEYKIIQGEKNIIEENIAINKELSDKKKINYDDIFYITEINSIGFLKDPNYMLTHDLCDIPGLSEYQEQKNDSKPENKEIENQANENLEEMLKKGEEFGLVYKPKEEKTEEYMKNINKEEDDIFYDMNIDEESTYITEIYKRIKDHIDGAIIVLSIENYNFTQNIEIIAKLHKIIEKKLKNFLIILNKIDLSTNQKLDIESCKGILFNAFPRFKTFNLNMNTFIPISAIQVQNELLLEKSFSHLIYYYFYEYKKYIMNSKLINNNISNRDNFVEYLRCVLKKLKITKQEIDNAMDELNNNEDISKINEEIKTIINYLTKISKGEYNLGIEEKDITEDEEEDMEDFLTELKAQKDSANKIDDVEALSILKMIYFLYRKKELLPQKSNETNQLLDYFTIKNEIDDDNKNDEESDVKNIKLNNQIIDALKLFYEEFNESDSDVEQIHNLSNEVEKLIEYLKIYDVIFVPFFGASNVGKSTIINGIIGKDLLPCDLRECTKRGIIIKYYTGKPVIKKAYFLEEEFSSKKYYYFQASEDTIGKGEFQIQQTLRGLNYKFNDNEEDSFYYIKTRIKLFDDLGLDKSLKDMIYLIDFPGYGTGNFFEKKICNEVISICNSFIFVSRNSVIKSKETKFALDSFLKAKENKKQFSSQLIKSSIFVFNIGVEQTSTNEDIEKAKEDIQELIKGVDKSDIKLSFYNAKFFLNYCNEYNYFYNFKDSLKKEYDDYIYKNSGYFKLTDENKLKKEFPKVLLQILIEKAGKYKVKIKKNQKYDKEIEESINQFLIDIGEENNPNKNNLIKLSSFCKENIEQINILEESNVQSFKEILKSQIKYVNEKKQKELRESIDNILSIFDLFFGNDFEKNKKEFKEVEDFRNKMKNLKQKIHSLIKENIENNKKIIETLKGQILVSLYDRKKKLGESLIEKNREIILNEINTEIGLKTQNLTNDVLKLIADNNAKCNEIFKEIVKVINNFQHTKIESFNKYNYKEHLANVFGNGEKDFEKQIMIEIKEKCENLTDIYNKKGFMEWLASFFSNIKFMQNVIDMVVDTYSLKIENFLKMIVNESNEYLKKVIEKIDNHISLSTMEFNDTQKKKWKSICKKYEETKAKILELEKNNNNN